MFNRMGLLGIALGAVLLPQAVLGEQRLILPDLAVGRNLQVVTMIKFAEHTPDSGMSITLTSGDPSRLLFSNAPDEAGSGTIMVKVLPRFVASAEFWVQGLADQGQVTYSVAAPGIGTANGTVTLAPSAIVIRPAHISSTPRGFPRKISLVSAMLDSDRKVVSEQEIAGGMNLTIEIANSHPEVGKLLSPRLSVAGGQSLAVTAFAPSALGSTTLAPSQPAGFTVPSEMATVEAGIQQPSLSGLAEVYLGKDLQAAAGLVLGEPAPPGGLKATLKSADPSKLLISDRRDQLGSGSVTLSIPEGQFVAPYYLQALGDSGEVTYTASAPGFRAKEHRIGLAASAVIVTYEHVGPPDEAAVVRRGGQHSERRFFPSISEAKSHPIRLTVYTAYLDPVTGMAADITVQPLRPGINLSIPLDSSNPAVATVESPVIISAGTDSAKALFTPLSKGEAIISIKIPAGMTKSRNASSVPATVGE